MALVFRGAGSVLLPFIFLFVLTGLAVIVGALSEGDFRGVLSGLALVAVGAAIASLRDWLGR
jgi:hypothetical protein